MTDKGQNMLKFYYNQLLKCTVVMLSKLNMIRYTTKWKQVLISLSINFT